MFQFVGVTDTDRFYYESKVLYDNKVTRFSTARRYSYVSNKRRATFILFEEIFQALRCYSRPYVYLFLKKIIENLGEN